MSEIPEKIPNRCDARLVYAMAKHMNRSLNHLHQEGRINYTDRKKITPFMDYIFEVQGAIGSLHFRIGVQESQRKEDGTSNVSAMFYSPNVPLDDNFYSIADRLNLEFYQEFDSQEINQSEPLEYVDRLVQLASGFCEMQISVPERPSLLEQWRRSIDEPIDQTGKNAAEISYDEEQRQKRKAMIAMAKELSESFWAVSKILQKEDVPHQIRVSESYSSPQISFTIKAGIGEINLLAGLESQPKVIDSYTVLFQWVAAEPDRKAREGFRLLSQRFGVSVDADFVDFAVDKPGYGVIKRQYPAVLTDEGRLQPDLMQHIERVSQVVEGFCRL